MTYAEPDSTRSPGYGWLILANAYWDGPIADMTGPDDLDEILRVRLRDGQGDRFRLGHRTMYGEMYFNEGRYLGPRPRRHTPLTEHGHNWSGATFIDYEINGEWVREYRLVWPPLRTRVWRRLAGSVWALLRRGNSSPHGSDPGPVVTMPDQAPGGAVMTTVFGEAAIQAIETTADMAQVGGLAHPPVKLDPSR